MINILIIECELKHVLDRLINDHERNPLQFFIMPINEVDGSKFYKHISISDLNGNPMLSKVWLTGIEFGILYVIFRV